MRACAPRDAACGGQAPFDPEAFKAALAKATEEVPAQVFYSAGGVFQWVNHLWNPTPGVKINESVVNDIVNRDFKNGPPKYMKHKLVIAVMANEGSCLDCQAIVDGRGKGGMLAISPCEFAHAAIKACARDVSRGVDAVLRQWRQAFLSVQFDFVRIDASKASMHAFQQREDMLAKGEQVAWTTLQRVQMVIREKYAMEYTGAKCTSAKLASTFAEGVTLAKSSESMSAAFVDAALTVESRVLSQEVCVEALAYLEDTYGIQSPFNSVYKLQTVVNRAKTQSAITWCFQSLTDSLRMKFMEVEDFSVSKLNTIHCEVAVLKMEFRDYFLTKFLDGNAFPSHAKQVLRSMLADHKAVRSHLTAYPDEKCPDLSWLNAHNPSVSQLAELAEALRIPHGRARTPQQEAISKSFTFGEKWVSQSKYSCCLRRFCSCLCKAIVYGDSYDATLRAGVRNRKGVDDVLTYNVIKEAIDGVLETLEKEKIPASSHSASGAGEGEQSSAIAPGGAREVADDGAEASEDKGLHDKLSGMETDSRAHWQGVAERLVRQYIRIVVAPTTDAGVAQEVKASELACSAGSMSGLTLLHYDVKLSGEPATAPKLRISPFQEKPYKQMVQGILEGRWRGEASTRAQLNAGDVVLLLDAGRVGNEKV